MIKKVSSRQTNKGFASSLVLGTIALTFPLALFGGSSFFKNTNKETEEKSYYTALAEYNRLVALNADCSKPFIPDYSREPFRVPSYSRAPNGGSESLIAYYPLDVDLSLVESEAREDLGEGARMDYFGNDAMAFSSLVAPSEQGCVRIDVVVDPRRVQVGNMTTPLSNSNPIKRLAGSGGHSLPGPKQLPRPSTVRIRFTQGGRGIGGLQNVRLQAFPLAVNGTPRREGFTRGHNHANTPASLLLAEQQAAFLSCLSSNPSWGTPNVPVVCSAQQQAAGNPVTRATAPDGTITIQAMGQFRGTVEVLQISAMHEGVRRVLHHEVAIARPHIFVPWTSIRMRTPPAAGRFARPEDVQIIDVGRRGEAATSGVPMNQYPFLLGGNTRQGESSSPHNSTHWVDARVAPKMFAAWYNVWHAGRGRVGDNYRVALNQMNLEYGGEFKVESGATCNFTTNRMSHKTHSMGTDFDMSPCLVGPGQGYRTGAVCRGYNGPYKISDADAKRHIEDSGAGGLVFVHNEMTSGWHWHVRFSSPAN